MEKSKGCPLDPLAVSKKNTGMMFHRMLILSVSLMMSACTPSQPGGGGNGNDNGGGVSGTLTGELVFFSGRPAPEWTIPASEHAGLAEKLQGLTATQAPEGFPRFGPVGYRLMNSGVAGVPDGVLVQDGIVELQTGNTYTYFTDDKQLEAALRQSAESDGVFSELGLENAVQKSAP